MSHNFNLMLRIKMREGDRYGFGLQIPGFLCEGSRTRRREEEREEMELKFEKCWGLGLI